MTTQPDRTRNRRLAERLNQRRIVLRLQWQEVADRAGISAAHLRNFRNGQGTLGDLAKASLEDALRWKRGSIDAVLQGGEPTEVASVSGSTSLAVTAQAGVETSAAIEAALRELARRLPTARVQAVLQEFAPPGAEPDKPAGDRRYEDPSEQAIWDISTIEPVIRRQLIGMYRVAKEAMEEEDLRPNADVREFRPRG
jgi:transcriptional regulator with XRE-family HTH domain